MLPPLRALTCALCALSTTAFAQKAQFVGTGGTLHVVATTPAAVSSASVNTSVSVTFDRPIDLSTVDRESWRVFGRYSGPHTGHWTFSQGGRRITFRPDEPFSAGEVVWVNLAKTIQGMDRSRLRSAGYAFQFGTSVAASSGTFTEYDVLSNRDCCQTRIYGASATDLDHDGFLDLTTVNEVSADLRVFPNLGDGTGNYGAFLTPEPIGDEASPNEPADFDNDGNADLCVAATDSGDVWIVLGNGDCTFAPPQSIDVGNEPHGIVTLDVDGDADLDIVNCNFQSNNLSLMINDGSGVFGSPSYFEGGVNGEFGLAAGDMDKDGITDLVVAGETGWQVHTLLGNGDGTFTALGPAQTTGGATWVVQLGDVDGDGDLDASTANATSQNAAILKNNGTGFLTAPALVNLGAHTVSTDLGDLDGDGDLDWAISSFGGGFWRLYRNNGSGAFNLWHEIEAPSNPSCCILLDMDNDGDLDLALTDEIADVVVLMAND